MIHALLDFIITFAFHFFHIPIDNIPRGTLATSDSSDMERNRRAKEKIKFFDSTLIMNLNVKASCRVQTNFIISLNLFSAQRSSRQSANANFNRRSWHPAESHRRIYLILLLTWHVLTHKVRTRSMVVCESSWAIHGAIGTIGLWEIMLRWVMKCDEKLSPLLSRRVSLSPYAKLKTPHADHFENH